MKRTLSLLLVTAMLTAVFSLCLSFISLNTNPFEFYDDLRNESIKAATNTSLKNGNGNGKDSAEEGYIVTFKKNADMQAIYDCVSLYDFKLLADSTQRIFKLNLESPEDFESRYADIIESIEAERPLYLSAVVDDPLAGDQWELDYLQAYSAWDISTGDREVTVAVLDSGVYRMHPDFEGVTILAGYDAVDRVNVINVDHNGHGTKVISIIAAATNNGIGMAGVGRNLSILPIRVSDYSGYIHSADFIEAVYYAADAGVDVINMSFGGYTYSAMEEAAMEYAASKGCLLVSAAGNKETDAQYAGMKAYPASYSSVISVGSVDETGVLCSFSQRNDDVDMVAPGFNITVANMSGGYEKELGTSFSCAYVSAVAALALSAIDEGVGFTADQFVSLVAYLNGGKKDIGYGYGAVNAAQVLQSINIPLVSGVTNGGVYHKNVTVTFNRGTATLDDKPFYSGDGVITSGSHTLTVTDGENEFNVSFITDNIPLKYDYKVGSSSAAITFNRGTATLDGAPYTSGAEISAEGRHYFVLTGPYGNTESFEFKCDFKAPAVFGVKNGVVYDRPVYITAERGGTLTLNGKTVQSGTVVSRNGAYNLVSSTADGKVKSTVYFTVSIPNVSLLNPAVSGSKLIADDEYKTLILYNTALSGIRVFSWSDLSRTMCFVRTESGVTGYGFTDESLILMHRYGVAVCKRSSLALGRTSDVVDYKFKEEALASFYMNGYVYYVSNADAHSVLYRMDVTTGESTAITVINGSVRFLCHDGDTLVAATDNGEIFLYTFGGKLINRFNTDSSISSIVAGEGYICTNGFVYSTSKQEKLFALRNDEKLILVKNGVLVTDRSVYDIKSNSYIASFGEAFIDLVFTDSGYVFKSLSNSKIERINNGTTAFSANNSAAMLNAAPCNETLFGDKTEVSNYESNAAIPEGTDITAAVLQSGTKNIYAISATKRTLYVIDGKELQVTAQLALRYEPYTLCSDGKNVYVSFKNEAYIMCYSIAEKKVEYYSCTDTYIKLECTGGKLFALNGKGNLYAFSTDKLSEHPETVIKAQNVLDFVCDDGFVYVYLKPVTITMVYKINADDFSIAESAVISSNATKIHIAEGVILVGNKGYDAESMEQLYLMDEQVRYAYGKYLVGEKGIYRSTDGTLVSNCRIDLSTPMFASDYSYYSIESDRISCIRNIRADLESVPGISGISNGAVLDGPISIQFDYGIGYIDGELYSSGTPVENGGLHSFVLALPFGFTYSVQFTINADINYIVLKAEKNSIRVNESIKLSVNAHPFTYGVVDVVYSTDNSNAVVLPDGSLIGAAAGECTVTASTADGEHKAAVKVTITEGFIEFDSSYFFADTEARIVKGIAAGTDVEAFLIAASQTKGDLAVRGYNGVQINAGMIHTGMTAELSDIYGNVIDEWHLSVLGDIDGDGFITANDYYSLDTMLSHPEGFTPTITAAADVDSNGVANAFDLLTLKEHLLGQSVIGDASIAPTRISSATAHIIMPEALSAGSSFTATVTLTDMKGFNAISALLKYDSSLLSLTQVSVEGKHGGFFTNTPDGLYFFSDIDNSSQSTVTLLAVFAVSEYADIGASVSINCEDVLVYDGSAAVINDGVRTVRIVDKAEPEVLIHNLPGFIFDKQSTDNRLVFPADTQKIHVSAYPMEIGDIAGELSFGNRLNASFAVVFTDPDGSISQYNYECEKAKSDGATSLPNTNVVYKNSNTSLTSITVSGGVLSPVFDKSISSYYVVTADPESVVVDAAPESVLSVTEVLPFNAENGTLTIKCVAEDGSVGEYTLYLCSELPIEYDAENEASASPWLWLIPALALLAIAAVVYVYQKKSKDKEAEQAL